MAAESNDTAIRLRDALQKIFKFSLDTERATTIGVASVVGTAVATVLAAPVVAASIAAALGIGTAALLLRKVKNGQLEKELLEEGHFTEREKKFLKEFEEKLKSIKTKEGKETILKAYSEKVAEIVGS
jgi:hypothetical protein